MNGNLVNLFRCTKHHPEALQKELEFILMSREQFFDAKEQMEVKGLTDIQRAARFYILIKESFGSDIRTFGVNTLIFATYKHPGNFPKTIFQFIYFLYILFNINELIYAMPENQIRIIASNSVPKYSPK